MAEDDDTGTSGAGNEDLRVEASTLLFELRLAIEATIAGIQRVITRPIAAPVQGELSIVLRLMQQGAEALNTLDDVLERFLKRRSEEDSANGV
jgi:hypothetical protein